MAIKIMLVEDESGIRRILRKVIERRDGFEVVGECDNMSDAIILFTKYRPEVVFMDIEIKGCSGMDCAKVIVDIEPRTKIIFATAHSEYMSNAFELYAFDYLMKPFDIARVEHTLERIQNMEKEDISKDTSDKVAKYDGNRDKLIVKGKESIIFVDTSDIILIQRENGSTVIHTKDDAYTTSAGLGDIEDKLDMTHFMRSHKSYIISISHIKRIEPYGRWTYTVLFKDTKMDALMTKENYDALKCRFC